MDKIDVTKTEAGDIVLLEMSKDQIQIGIDADMFDISDVPEKNQCLLLVLANDGDKIAGISLWETGEVMRSNVMTYSKDEKELQTRRDNEFEKHDRRARVFAYVLTSGNFPFDCCYKPSLVEIKDILRY